MNQNLIDTITFIKPKSKTILLNKKPNDWSSFRCQYRNDIKYIEKQYKINIWKHICSITVCIFNIFYAYLDPDGDILQSIPKYAYIILKIKTIVLHMRFHIFIKYCFWIYYIISQISRMLVESGSPSYTRCTGCCRHPLMAYDTSMDS